MLIQAALTQRVLKCIAACIYPLPLYQKSHNNLLHYRA